MFGPPPKRSPKVSDTRCFINVLGGSENVNYAVHLLMALLVQTKMVESIYCNRLPPG